MQTPEGASALKETITTVQPAEGGPQVRRHTLQESAILACAGGLLVCFFAPWVTAGFATTLSGASLARGQGAWFYWLIPILAVATLGSFRRPHLRSWIATVTVIVTWVVVQQAAFKLASTG